MGRVKRLLKSKWTINILLFVFSIIIGTLLYVGFFMDMLPRFFANMENIDKNILAIFIVIFSIYLLLKIVFSLDTKVDRYLLFLLYVIVLVLGLLRPDQQNFGETRLYAWNPFGFISDIKGDFASMIVMVINLIIFLPMYFLLAYTKIFNTFTMRLIIFEIFAFLIEFLQAQFKVGVFDLSDIFLYNVGFFVGCVVFYPILKALKKRSLRYKKYTEGEG
ncbi:VanZ family protein [Heyndrickxia faecalis]|uniref:VanZ family protein n=1 Tax=Heyndrickxia faecalis TaxID=2824910 RepID=UPI003D1C9300